VLRCYLEQPACPFWNQKAEISKQKKTTRDHASGRFSSAFPLAGTAVAIRICEGGFTDVQES
jgi:hypothetical protein